MGLNIDYEVIANYIIIIGLIIILVTIIKSILPILTYNELKKQRKILEQNVININTNSDTKSANYIFIFSMTKLT